MTPWKMGFTGALTDEMCRWVDSSIPEEVETICVPFLGSAKAVSLFTRDYRVTDCWDTQYIVRCVVEGIWQKKEAEITFDKPKLKKGYVFEDRPFVGIPDDAAGIIDWIASNSSMYEKVALMTAIARNTYRGRISQWGGGGAKEVWESYQTRIEAQKNYLDLPGEIRFHQQNFYEADLSDRKFDMAYIDPPKIISNTDAYSGTYGSLNRAVGPPEGDLVEFDRWTRYDYIGRMRLLMEAIDAPLIVFIYTSDVRPNLDELKDFLQRYGTIEKEHRVKHRSRMDYALVVRRG